MTAPSPLQAAEQVRPTRAPTSRSLAEVALGVALALPLAVYAYVGSFTRYTADDFCWAGILRTEGFFNAQIHYYTNYSPRYAFTFLVNLTELIGPPIVPALPAAAIIIWLSVLTWTFAQFVADTPRSDAASPDSASASHTTSASLPSTARASVASSAPFNAYARGFLLAEVAALATFATAPDLPQSLYWQTGLLTYLVPLILATFLIGWILRDNHAWWAVILSGALTFIAGGLSETYLIPQNVALTLALLVAIRFRSRRAHVTAALVGGVVALIVIISAPATAGRVQGTPANLWLAMSAAIATGYFQVYRLIRFFPFVILLCLGVAALIGEGPRRITMRWFVLVTVAVAITFPFCYFPSFYAQNGNPPARSLLVPAALMVGYLVFVSFALRDFAARWLPEPRRAIVLAAVALVPIGVAWTTLPDAADAARYAVLFDAEDQQIRASRDAGAADLSVPRLPQNMGEDFVGADPDNWFNQCVARYYGVRSIAASS